MSKRNIIRVGDIIEIVNPQKFIRCGYPLTTEDIIRNHMTTDDAKSVDNLLEGMDIWPGGQEYNIVFDKIVSAIARYKLWNKGWGGNERTIHTQEDNTLLGKPYKVLSKRVVQTGKRIPGWYDSYNQDGESPSFKSSGSHIILKLVENFDIPMLYSSDEEFEIETKNVKRL